MTDSERRTVNIDGENVTLAVCLERIHGNMKLLSQKAESEFTAIGVRFDSTDGRLDKLNAFKAKCEGETKEHEKEYRALVTRFESCNAEHKTIEKTKEKSAGKVIVYLTLAISLITLALLFIRTL